LGAFARPFGFTVGVRRAKIPLPHSSAGAITDWAGPLQGVASAFGAVQRDMALGPGNAAGEAAV